MSRSRFIFLSTLVQSGPDDATDGVFWLLVSSNNRQLGRGCMIYHSYHGCRSAAVLLREQLDRVRSQTTADDVSGQWMWRVELDGATIAASSRSYLRMRECQYNLDRFLEAVPHALLVDGVREVHHVPRHLVA